MARLARAVTWVTRGLVLAALLAAAGFVLFIHTITAERIPDGRTADAIVALTGGKARIGEAVRLLSEKRAKRLLISGVNPSTTKEHLRRLVSEGNDLFKCCIDLGRRAEDTTGNAEETRKWVEQHGFKSVIVVTSSYHMPRTLAELKRVMPGIVILPHTVEPLSFRSDDWWRDKEVLRLMMSEYVKYLPALARLYAARLTGEAAAEPG